MGEAAVSDINERKQLTFEGLDVDIEGFKVKSFAPSSALSNLKLGQVVRVTVDCEVVDVRHPRDKKTGVLERLHILAPVEGHVVEEL